MTPLCALQIDPLESLKYESDTSILLAEEIQRRGFQIFYYTPNHIFLDTGSVKAKGRYIKLNYTDKNFFTYLSEEIILDVTSCKILLVRQDPPFDMNYITTTYFLELLKKKGIAIVNNPSSIRNWPEKLSVFKFPEFIPPTTVSKDIDVIVDFYYQHRNILLKAVYDGAGNSICKVTQEDKILHITRKYIKKYGYVIAQKFFPEIKHGDKRILIVDGEILGAIKRVPLKHGYLANLAKGGTALRTVLTDKELKISKVVGKSLKKNDIFFAGLDLINEHLIEINVTSPTTCKIYNNLYNTNCEKLIVDRIFTKFNL